MPKKSKTIEEMKKKNEEWIANGFDERTFLYSNI